MTEFEPLSGTWPTATYALNVNDAPLVVDTAWLGESLLFALRERGALTAAKDGCGQDGRGECGACTVFLDGEPTVSCLVPAVAAVGRTVTTPEAFATVPPDAVASALADQAGPGCGFCLPGIAMSLRALLAHRPAPSAAAVREALSGHQCRCLGIDRFLAAVVSLTQGQQAQEGQQGQPGPSHNAHEGQGQARQGQARQGQGQGQRQYAQTGQAQPHQGQGQRQYAQADQVQPHPGQVQYDQFEEPEAHAQARQDLRRGQYGPGVQAQAYQGQGHGQHDQDSEAQAQAYAWRQAQLRQAQARQAQAQQAQQPRQQSHQPPGSRQATDQGSAR